MVTPEQHDAAKRRIMFIAGEDFNFLTYNILIILHSLDATSSENSFVDHRKLAFLVNLVSSPMAYRILLRRKRLHARLGTRDIHTLSTAYAQGIARRHLVERVLYVLTRRGLLQATQANADGPLRFHLDLEAVPSGFLTSDVYALERETVSELKRLAPTLRKQRFETFLERFFSDHGVQTWQV